MPRQSFRWVVRVLGTLALVFVSRVATADLEPSKLIRKGATPAWIVPTPVDPAARVDDAESSDGFYTLLDEERIRLGKKDVERYVRRVHKIVSSAGIEALAEISIEVEPDQEQLVLHAVRIHRDGTVIDALPTASTRLVQQESELDRHIYRGTLTAYVILRDVRVGDVVEVAHSILGQNPVLDGHFAGSFALGGRHPIGRLRREIVVERSRPRALQWRVHGKGPAPAVTEGSNTRVFSWDLADVAPVPFEDRLPDWYDDVPWVQLSEFESWEDVVTWGLTMYSLRPPFATALQKKADEIRNSATEPNDQILHAVRFVQDDVRYLSISVGPYSHRPHELAQVLEQRFGDCKDKSMLLAALLQELGVQAYPALVNTRVESGLAGRLPSAFDFDHVVVKAIIDGKPVWIDATASNQGGNIETQVPASFGAALVMQTGVRALEAMPKYVPKEPDDSTWSEFRIEQNGTATLDVKTEFRGENADAQRARIARTPRSQVATSYLEFYTESFPGINASAALDVQDDRTANVIRLVERYTIPKFWQDGSRWLDSESIASFMKGPHVKRRRGPLAVSHPVWSREELRVRLPRPWEIESESETIEDPTFLFSFSAEAVGETLIVTREYQTRADVVPVKQLAAHLKRLDQVGERLSFEVPKALGEPKPEPFRMGRTEWTIAAVTGGFVLSGTFLALWLPGRRRRAFFKRRDGAVGESPAYPVAAADADAAMRLVSKWRCSCGGNLDAGADDARWSELRFGGAALHLLQVTCHRCGAAMKRYFALDAPPAAVEERTVATQGEDTKAAAITVIARLTRTEIVDARLRMYFASRFGKTVTIGSIVLPVVQWQLAPHRPVTALWYALFGLIVFPILTIIAGLSGPMVRELMETGFEYRLSDAGVHVESRQAKVDYGWPLVLQALETDAAFVVAVRGAIIILPKRCLRSPALLDAVRELLRAHVRETDLR